MKFKPVNTSVGILFCVPLLLFAFGTPSRAEQSPGNFYCGTSVDRETNTLVPTLMVNHPDRGKIAVIKFISQYFSKSDYTPQKRCDISAKKFQANKDNRNLNFLVPGRNGKHEVVCASTIQVGYKANCLNFEVLLTYNPETKVSTKGIIKSIMGVNASANSTILLQGSNGLFGNEEDGYSLHLETFMLNGAEVVEAE